MKTQWQVSFQIKIEDFSTTCSSMVVMARPEYTISEHWPIGGELGYIVSKPETHAPTRTILANLLTVTAKCRGSELVV